MLQVAVSKNDFSEQEAESLLRQAIAIADGKRPAQPRFTKEELRAAAAEIGVDDESFDAAVQLVDAPNANGIQHRASSTPTSARRWLVVAIAAVVAMSFAVFATKHVAIKAAVAISSALSVWWLLSRKKSTAPREDAVIPMTQTLDAVVPQPPWQPPTSTPSGAGHCSWCSRRRHEGDPNWRLEAFPSTGTITLICGPCWDALKSKPEQ